MKPTRTRPSDPAARFTRWIIVLAALLGACRLLTLPANPSFGDNDRSRWATVRALVDQGSYAIGARRRSGERLVDTGIVVQTDWQTVDRVLHPTEQQYYSSKPPLLPTALAGEYWLLKRVCGWAITKQTRAVMLTLLFTFNWLPNVLALASFDRTLRRATTNVWARCIVLASAAFGTLLTSFLTTLNNHTVAACAVIFTLEVVFLIVDAKRCEPWLFAAGGLCAGWAAANELPAASWLLAMFALLLRQAPRRTLLYFAPAALLPLSAFLVTNQLAVGRLTPIYATMGTIWYNYPGSYWNSPTGIDALAEPKLTYLFNMLFGHHGFFLVSPVLLFGLGGVWQLRHRAGELLRTLSLLVLLVSAVTFAFYMLRSNNYGGNSAGLRWAIWLAPLWLVLGIPAVEVLGRRAAGRALCLVLLALSSYGALVHFHNPWVSPWLEPVFGPPT